MYGTLPPGRGADYPSAWVDLPGGLGEALIVGAHPHAHMVIMIPGGEFDIATAPGLSGRLEPLAETGDMPAVLPLPSRSTPRRDFSKAAGCARAFVGFCFEVFEPGKHDG